MQELKKFLVSGGRYGSMPDYYPLIKAARYLMVAPWDLAERGNCWQEWAFVCESAETQAQNEIQRRAMKK